MSKQDLIEKLVEAVEEQDFKTAQSVLKSGMSANIEDGYLLFCAVDNNDIKMLSLLVKHGGNVDKRPIGREHLVHSALLMGSVEILAIVMRNSEELKGKEKDILSEAIGLGKADLCQLILNESNLSVLQNPDILKKALHKGDEETIKVVKDHITKEQEDALLVRQKLFDAFLEIEGIKKMFEEMNVSELRDYDGKDHSGIELSVLAGKFNELVQKSKESETAEGKLSYNDFQSSGENKKSILDILAEDRKLEDAFDPGIWAGRSKEMRALWENMPKEYQDQIDIQDMVSKANRLGLHKHGRKGRKP